MRSIQTRKSAHSLWALAAGLLATSSSAAQPTFTTAEHYLSESTTLRVQFIGNSGELISELVIETSDRSSADRSQARPTVDLIAHISNPADSRRTIRAAQCPAIANAISSFQSLPAIMPQFDISRGDAVPFAIPNTRMDAPVVRISFKPILADYSSSQVMVETSGGAYADWADAALRRISECAA